MRRKRRNQRGALWLALALIFLTGAILGPDLCARKNRTEEVGIPASQTGASVTVWYFDMGQGNASLVESDGHYMLIDTGNYGDVERLKRLLLEAGVKKLDYMVATHPHADHIGSLAAVIREYEIGTLLMPKAEADTKTYRVAMEAAKERQLRISTPEVGDRYSLGQVEFQVLAPQREGYENLNDWSIALRLTCEETDFLWTGDAQAVSEQEMLESGLSLEAEVYHAGHHGSNTSSGEVFLEAIDPEYAVISCGAENDYGYPHLEVLERLMEAGAAVYTTADQGTIRVSCRENVLLWETEKECIGEQ